MIKVTLNYELTDKMGSTLELFWKEVEMPAAPTKDLVFDDQDFTFKANRSIQYSLHKGAYFVRHVDSFSDVRKMGEMFTKLGWIRADW